MKFLPNRLLLFYLLFNNLAKSTFVFCRQFCCSTFQGNFNNRDVKVYILMICSQFPFSYTWRLFVHLSLTSTPCFFLLSSFTLHVSSFFLLSLFFQIEYEKPVAMLTSVISTILCTLDVNSFNQCVTVHSLHWYGQYNCVYMGCIYFLHTTVPNKSYASYEAKPVVLAMFHTWVKVNRIPHDTVSNDQEDWRWWCW